MKLGDRVEVCRSGCLDQCEAGAVALVYKPNRSEFSWLPTKLRLKLQRLLFSHRYLYGHLTCVDIPAIVSQECVFATNK
jgi:(2Fe-2S) ferredoxin